MSGELKPYPEMQDSGVRWLGKVPAHWKVRRLRNIAEMRISNVDKHTKEGERPVRLCNYVDVYKNDRIRSGMGFMKATATTEEVERFRLRSRDVLITKDSEAWNDIGVPALVQEVEDDVVSGYHLALLRSDTRHLDGEFLFRALQSRDIAYQLHEQANGVTRYGLSHNAIKSVWIPVPPLPEQTAIARFLDHADRRIQRSIRAKEKLIALLEEQKRAVIHEVVTGRIDVRTGRPYRAYKTSGVEWFEQLPAHWEIRRLKSIVRRIDQGVSPQAENRLADNTSWGVLKAGCVNGGVFRETEHKRLPLQTAVDPVLAVRTGDVLVSRASGSARFVGSVGRIPSLRHNLILSDKTFRPIFNHAVDPDFMVLAMNCRYYRQQVEQAISGAEGLANNLPLSSLKSFRFAVPPLHEQRRIVTCLRDFTDKLTASTTRTTREIALLNELNATLITNVVSGKVDVREAAAALPEVDPLAADDPDAHAEAAGDPMSGTGTETVEEFH